MRTLALAGACLAAALIALPAFGDIKSFNAAVTARDFNKAAAEAASTWPTLDKSREDIATIAREFGFVSYVAKDYEAAKTYAEFATAKMAEGAAPAELKSQTFVLLRLSELKLKPSPATRDALYGSLDARAALADYDNISFAATDALVAYDLDKGRWKDAAAAIDLAVKLSSAGGPGYSVERRRYELFGGVADYMVSKKPQVLEQFSQLRISLLNDISAAPSDAAAQKFVPLLWEVSAWRETLDAHLISRGIRNHTKGEGYEFDKSEHPDTNGRLRRRLGGSGSEGCQKKFDQKEKPSYPPSALYQGFVGSVIVRVDVDAEGKTSNPEILAAVPEKYFGDAVLKSVKDMRYLPGEIWGPSCSLAETGRVIAIKFQIGRR